MSPLDKLRNPVNLLLVGVGAAAYHYRGRVMNFAKEMKSDIDERPMLVGIKPRDFYIPGDYRQCPRYGGTARVMSETDRAGWGPHRSMYC